MSVAPEQLPHVDVATRRILSAVKARAERT
jgi:hypothetical protein